MREGCVAMDNGMKIFLVVLAIFVLGLPLVGKLAQEENSKQEAATTATATPDPEPAPAPYVAAPTPQYSPPPQPAWQAAPPQAPQAVQNPQRRGPNHPRPQGQQPPLLNAQNLANSVWKMKIEQYDVQVQLFAGGSALATAAGLPMAIQGSWSVNGANLVIKAMGKTQSVKIVGDQLMVNGAPAQRVR